MPANSDRPNAAGDAAGSALFETPRHSFPASGPQRERRYGVLIAPRQPRPRRTPDQLARAVGNGRGVAAALRHLDEHGDEHESLVVAEALAQFLVARCESHHAGWRVVRQVVVDSAAHAPWEKCARRAVPQVTQDLLRMAGDSGRTPLARAQHVAAQRRVEHTARFVDADAVLADLGLPREPVTPARWQAALSSAISARSREQVARAVAQSLRS